jgi:hypothetical protein
VRWLLRGEVQLTEYKVAHLGDEAVPGSNLGPSIDHRKPDKFPHGRGGGVATWNDTVP